jgi:hypothetical protein
MRPVRSSILAITALLLIAAPALAESKVSQCKRLAMADHKLETQFRTLIQQKGGDPVAQVERMLKLIETGAKQTRTMRFEDTTVGGFQQRVAGLYEQVHDDLVDVYDAAVRQDKAAMQQAQQKLNKRKADSNVLDQQFKQYCGFSR